MAVFASLKLNQAPVVPVINVVQPVASPIVEVKVVKPIIEITNQNIDLPTPTAVFVCQERVKKIESPKIIKPVEQPITSTAKPVTLEPTKTMPTQELFLHIAYNYNSAAMKRAQEFLNQVKTSTAPHALSFILPAAKVLVACQHGIVLQFDDELDAELLNSQTYKYDFLKDVSRFFEEPIYIMGIEEEKTRD
jgi:hypothetical protein